MYIISSLYLTKFKPWISSLVARVIYSGRYVKFGAGFRCDSIPKILIDKKSRVIIGERVVFGRNVEIRAHGESQIRIGDDVKLDRGVRVLSNNLSCVDINIGARIGLYTVLNGGDSITVGARSLISGFVYLQTSMHSFDKNDVYIQNQGYKHAPVRLGDDVWLGAHAVVLPGCSIGPGSIVGSNSVVTSDVQSGEIVGGVPAKRLKSRQGSSEQPK